MLGDLLQTKLHMPRSRPSLVPRPHLIDKLNQGLSGKLTLVSAPVGFGKTTLVTEWAMACDMPTAWLSLDEEDSEPVRFWRYFIAGLQTIQAGFGEEILPLFLETLRLRTAVAALINAISKTPHHIIFVLEDYHLIQSEALQESLTYFLERQPPQLHLVITTREDPPIPLPRWRARGELVEIRERDLRFTAAETTALLNDALGLNLTTQQIGKLDRKTEGWVSGLKLAALALREQPDVDQFVDAFAGSNRFILDYLIEEVFRQQPPDVRAFLLQTAVLEQLTASLCDAIMLPDGSGNAQAMLERLEKMNLFINPLDTSRQWFRYHPLFADLLRQRLRLAQMDTAELHQRAARWHEAHGFYRRAVNHYLQAAAWEQAAALIQSHNDDLQKRGENSTFLRWMRALPETVIHANPALCLDYAWALALNGQPDRADSFLTVAEIAYRENPARYGAVLSAQIHLARIRHDLPQTISLSQKALALLPAAASDPRSALLLNLGIAHWQQGHIADAETALTAAQEAAALARNHHVRLLAIGFLAMTQAAQGALHKAAMLLQSALEWGEALPASALPHLVLGALLYEWNRLDEARSHLQTAIDLAQRSGNSELTSSAYRQWAQLKLAEGDTAAAQSTLAEAEAAAGSKAPPLTQGRNHAAAVMIALARQNLELAQARIEKMETAVSASLFYAPLYLAPARLALARGDKAAAAAHLAAEFDRIDGAGWRYGQIEIRLLQALAAADAQDGLVFLTDALTMAQAQQFRRIFLDKGSTLLPLLHIAASKQIFPEYTAALLALFAGEEVPMPPPTTTEQRKAVLVEAISEREIEVLQLLADGRTNNEIAQDLFVSVNTVKSHLKSIYGKLNVSNRREAVSRARLLHLLSSDK